MWERREVGASVRIAFIKPNGAFEEPPPKEPVFLVPSVILVLRARKAKQRFPLGTEIGSFFRFLRSEPTYNWPNSLRVSEPREPKESIKFRVPRAKRRFRWKKPNSAFWEPPLSEPKIGFQEEKGSEKALFGSSDTHGIENARWNPAAEEPRRGSFGGGSSKALFGFKCGGHRA